jgi:hypothetical protein
MGISSVSFRISKSLECRQPDLERRRRGAFLGPGPAGMSAGAGEFDEAAGARQGWLFAGLGIGHALGPFRPSVRPVVPV